MFLALALLAGLVGMLVKPTTAVWENDPLLSTRRRDQELEEENNELKERLKQLESGSDSGSGTGSKS